MNSKIGILIYGSLYKKLSYNNNTIEDIIYFENGKQKYLDGPLLPLIFGRRNNKGYISRTIMNGVKEKKTYIYKVKSDISLEKAYLKLGLREGKYINYIGIYNAKKMNILYNNNIFMISKDITLNLLIYKLKYTCIKYNLDYILFTLFPYNLQNINLEEYIENNNDIKYKFIKYIRLCDYKTLDKYEKNLIK